MNNFLKPVFSYRPGGDILLHHLLETVIFTIHYYIRSLHSASKEELSTIHVDTTTKTLVIESLSSFGDFVKSFPSSLRLQYGPLLLYLLLRLTELSSVNSEFAPFFEPILTTLKVIAQSDSSGDWEQVLYSFLYSTLELEKYAYYFFKKIPNSSNFSSCPFQVLFVLLTSLPYKVEAPELHGKCIKRLNTILEQDSNIQVNSKFFNSTLNLVFLFFKKKKNQLQLLINIRNFAQSGLVNTNNSNTPLQKMCLTYLKAIIPSSVLLLQRISKQQQSGANISDDEFNLVSEIIKILTLVHISLSDPQQRIT